MYDIIIIGAGPAGLTAAETAADRGFRVMLFEKEDKAGGQINLAAAPPLKDKTHWFIEDAVAACKEKGVEIKLGTQVSIAQLKALSPYKVIIATGSVPVTPRFPGNGDKKNILTFKDILQNKESISGKKVAVIGSGLTGLETAHYLTEKGCQVTIIEMADEIAPGTWMQHKDDVLPHLKKAGAVIYTGEKLLEINNDHIVTENIKTKKRTSLPCDKVVLALGSKPENGLAKALSAEGISFINIGDSRKVGKIADATKAAFEEVRNI